MTDPDWLIKARAEGRVTSETGVKQTALPTAPISPTAQVVSHQAKPPRPQPAEPLPMVKLELVVSITPLKIKSEANIGGKLRDKITRKSAIKAAIKAALPELRFPLPCVVILARQGGKQLDEDNLLRSFKPVRDAIADWLGCDDADKRIVWKYRQTPAYQPGIKLTFREKE